MALKRFGNLMLDPAEVAFEDAKRLMDYLEGNAAAHGQTPDQTE